MKHLPTILILLLAGSLWGIAEILPLPTALHCACGILVLTLARKLAPVFGASVLIGLVVCLYKTAGVTFMECQWAGVLSIAISYEIMVFTLLRGPSRSTIRPIVAGVGACALALPLFIGWIVLVAEHPYWLAGGVERITSYALYTTGPAMIASAILVPVGLAVASVVDASLPLKRVPALLLSSVAISLCWGFALFA